MAENEKEQIEKVPEESISKKNEGVNVTKVATAGTSKGLIIAVSILAVLVVAFGAFAGFNYYKDKKDKSAQTTASATPAPSVIVTQSADAKVVDDGVTWIKPEKMADQKIFSLPTEGEELGICDSIEYYKVGTTSSGGVIIDTNINCGMSGVILERVIKNGNEYKRIVKNSSKLIGGIIPAKSLVDDNSFVFNSLSTDKTISKGLTQLVSSDNQKLDVTKGSWIESTKKLASTKWGDLNLDFSKDLSLNYIDGNNPDKTPILKIGSYDISLNDSSDQNYEVRPSFWQSDNTFDLTYAMPQAKANKYEKFETGGCGIGFGSSPIIADTTLITGAKEIGTKGASKVYTLTDTTNKLVQYSYAVYKMDGADGKKTIDQFVSDVGLAFWTDDYGNTIAFLNSDYKPAVECGKPVVYLYPQQETAFKVRVGAQMTKTDPVYDGAWVGVAKPNGELTVSGNKYPYLFWEGLGYGTYPAVESGKIVERSQVENQIRTDLAYIGLAQREIDDFLDFWMTKMPNSQYVRLTWFTNDQLDKLAPLSISPRPDSVIRVFLDFAGLNSKTPIEAQILPKYQRTGFTVVEWGGLLKGK